MIVVELMVKWNKDAREVTRLKSINKKHVENHTQSRFLIRKFLLEIFNHVVVKTYFLVFLFSYRSTIIRVLRIRSCVIINRAFLWPFLFFVSVNKYIKLFVILAIVNIYSDVVQFFFLSPKWKKNWKDFVIRFLRDKSLVEHFWVKRRQRQIDVSE